MKLADGRSDFAKCAHEDVVAAFLRDEHRLYSALEADYMPRLIVFIDEPPPILVLEDLSDATCPPPGASGAVELVLDTLARVHAPPPPLASRRSNRNARAWRTARSRIEDDPAPFVSLGVCSRGWLRTFARCS